MESLKEKESLSKKSHYSPIIIGVVTALIVFIAFLIINFNASNDNEKLHIMAPTEDYNSGKYLEENDNAV